jgi:hypothetical protein
VRWAALTPSTQQTYSKTWQLNSIVEIVANADLFVLR